MASNQWIKGAPKKQTTLHRGMGMAGDQKITAKDLARAVTNKTPRQRRQERAIKAAKSDK